MICPHKRWGGHIAIKEDISQIPLYLGRYIQHINDNNYSIIVYDLNKLVLKNITKNVSTLLPIMGVSSFLVQVSF